jgi:serine/threonine protein kinase
MTTDDWTRVEALFHAALDQPPTARSAYVDAESLGDEGLRHEVESLLAAHGQADGVLEEGAAPSLQVGRETDANPADIRPGGRLGAFEILDVIGAGGMGRVYRARDTRLDRSVAIKVLSPEVADDPRSRERLEREARVVSRLAHQHICTLYDLGLARVEGVETPFLVMELLDGETLAARLARGALPIEQTIRIASQIAQALSAAHANGIVHRDLKPANIMLTASGVKLLDFGLARWRGPVVASGATAADRAPDVLSTAGLIFGTLPYMAPEQLRGEAADGRSDLFAFGAVLYEMLTGARAFAADSQAALVAAILEHEPAALATHQPLTPPALSRLIARCLAKNPAKRWQHAQDVAFELTEIQERIVDHVERPVPPRRSDIRRYVRGLLPTAIVAGLLSLLLWSFVSRGDNRAAAATTRPVIVLMDSPGRVYDPATKEAGGTNADDLSDALADLPVILHKESTSSMWHREEQVRRQNPDLVISHLSCLLDARKADNNALEEHLFDLAQQRLTLFFGYLGTANARTRFLVYSRSHFATPELATTWVGSVVARFPHLEGRLHTMSVPGGRESATLRDPATGRTFRDQVKAILILRESSSLRWSRLPLERTGERASRRWSASVVP